MKKVLDALLSAFTSVLASPFFPYIVAGLVGLYIYEHVWKNLFGQQTVQDVAGNTIDAAASLPSGVLSAAESALKGESDSTYISNDQAKALAQQLLQAKLQGRTA